MGGNLAQHVPGQYDDLDAGDAPAKPGGAPPGASATAPADCAHRTRAEDAAASAAEIRKRLSGMDPALVAELCRARESAAGLTDVFPEGDLRFRGIESDEEDAGEGGDADGDEEDEEEEEEGGDGEGQGGREGLEGDECVGLLDGRLDAGPRAALRRAKADHGFDLVGEMARGGLGFLERVRLANYVRRCVRDGDAVDVVVQKVRSVVSSGVAAAGVLTDDAMLIPVLPGDVLLTVLEDGVEEGEGEAEGVAEAVERCLAVDAGGEE